jgi:hypothetical protein
MKEKGIFPFSATLDKSDQIFLLLPQFLLRISLFSSVLIPFCFSFTVPHHSSQVGFGTMSVTLHDTIYQSFKQERNE